MNYEADSREAEELYLRIVDKYSGTRKHSSPEYLAIEERAAHRATVLAHEIEEIDSIPDIFAFLKD